MLTHELFTIFGGVFFVFAAYYPEIQFINTWWAILILAFQNWGDAFPIFWMLWNISFMYWMSARQLLALQKEMSTNKT